MKAIKGFFKKPEKSIIDKDLKGDIHYIDSFRIKIRNINQYSIDYLTALMFFINSGMGKEVIKPA